MVITRTLEGGEIAFQAGHQPFLGALVESHTRIFQTDGTVQDIAVHRGFVEVSGEPTRVSILSDTAELASLAGRVPLWRARLLRDLPQHQCHLHARAGQPDLVAKKAAREFWDFIASTENAVFYVYSAKERST